MVQTKGRGNRWRGALETGTGYMKEQTNDEGTPGGVEGEKQEQNTGKTMQREQKQVERSSKTGTGTINARDKP